VLSPLVPLPAGEMGGRVGGPHNGTEI